MIRKLLFGLAAGLALLAFGWEPAGASTVVDVSPDSPVSTFLTVNNTLVLVVTGFVVPAVNGLLLRESNPVWIKVLVANGFATVVHALSQAIQDDGTALLTQAWFVGLFITLGTMTASYLGVWKPLANPNKTVPTVVPLGDLLALRRAA